GGTGASRAARSARPRSSRTSCRRASTDMGARRRTLAALLIAGLGWCSSGGAAAPAYSWLQGDAANTDAESIVVPDGFERSAAAPGSFGEWLRHLPLKAGGGVLLHDGRPVAAHGTDP